MGLSDADQGRNIKWVSQWVAALCPQESPSVLHRPHSVHNSSSSTSDMRTPEPEPGSLSTCGWTCQLIQESYSDLSERVILSGAEWITVVGIIHFSQTFYFKLTVGRVLLNIQDIIYQYNLWECSLPFNCKERPYISWLTIQSLNCLSINHNHRWSNQIDAFYHFLSANTISQSLLLFYIFLIFFSKIQNVSDANMRRNVSTQYHLCCLFQIQKNGNEKFVFVFVVHSHMPGAGR